jgi:hypothetical protein
MKANRLLKAARTKTSPAMTDEATALVYDLDHTRWHLPK